MVIGALYYRVLLDGGRAFVACLTAESECLFARYQRATEVKFDDWESVRQWVRDYFGISLRMPRSSVTQRLGERARWERGKGRPPKGPTPPGLPPAPEVKK